MSLGSSSQPHLPRYHRPSVTPCVYCGHPAYSVIEARFARTVKYAGVGAVSDDEAPREVISRGYYVCDGCLALLDFRVEHHLSPRKHSSFNALSVAYHAFAVWCMTALGSLAGFDAGRQALITTPRFLYLGGALGMATLVVLFLRARVHTRYYRRWRAQRQEPVRPRNSLAGFTALRDRVHPELAHYLPVRFADSLKLLSKEGSPPLRSLGPSGEPWGEDPPSNFAGHGEHEWYRLIWNSWQLWPLTDVEAREDWDAPSQPKLREFELACATIPALSVAMLLVEVVGQPWWLGLLCGALLWPIGLFTGLSVRTSMVRRGTEIDSTEQVG